MATTIGGISIDIGVNPGGVANGMNKAKSEIRSGVDSIQGAASALKGYIAMLGIDAFGGYIKSAIDAAGALADLSQKTGISAETLSGLEYAAKMSGTTLDGVANGLKKLAMNMYDTSRGSGDAQEAFKSLGISVADASGKLKTTDGVMLEVADRFKEMDDGPKKAALAMKIFGKSGEELIPLLNEGAEGIAAMRQRAEELGLTVSDQTASAMEALGDKFDTIGMAGQGAARQLAADLTPALTSVADLFLESTKKGGFLTTTMGLLGDTIRGLISIGYGAASVFEQIGMAIGGLLAAAASAVTGNFEGAREILRQNEADVAASSDRWASKIKDVWAEQVVATGKATQATNEHTEATKKQIAEAEKQAKQIATVTGKLMDELEMLKMTSVQAGIYKELKAAGVTANSAAGKEIARLVTTLDKEKESLKAAAEAAKENTKEVDALFDAQEKLRLGNEDQIKTARTMLEQIEFETKLLGMNADQRAIATLERDLETKGIVKGTQAYDAYIQRLKDATALKGVTEAQVKLAEDSNKAWTDTAKDIEKALTDSLMRGFESGKGFWDSIKDYIVNGAKSMAVKILVQPIMGTIGSLFGMGSAMAGTGGGGGGGADSILGNLGSIGSAFSAFGGTLATGFMNTVAGTGFGASMGAAGSMIGSGSYASGFGMAAGAIAPYAIAALVIKELSGYKIEATGNALTATVGASGVLNGKVGTRADFNQTSSGIFSGGNTKNSTWGVADAGTTGYINAAVQNVTATNAAYAQILGLNASALDAYTKALDINITGMDAAAAQTAINTEVQKFGVEQVTAAYGEALAQYAKAGETVFDTLKRLAGIEVASAALNEFGGIFSRIATLGIEGRDSMFALAGGIEAFVKKSSDFVKLYYSADEQSGLQARGVLDQLNAAGVTDASQLSNKEEFRALVESIDVSNESGRAQLNALLTIAPQFAQVSEYLKANNIDLGDLAALAPQIAALDPLFQQNNDAATANATAATDATTASINATTDAINSNTTAVVAAVNNVAASVAAAVRDGMAAAGASSAQVGRTLDDIAASNRLAAERNFA